MPYYTLLYILHGVWADLHVSASAASPFASEDCIAATGLAEQAQLKDADWPWRPTPLPELQLRAMEPGPKHEPAASDPDQSRQSTSAACGRERPRLPGLRGSNSMMRCKA